MHVHLHMDTAAKPNNRFRGNLLLRFFIFFYQVLHIACDMHVFALHNSSTKPVAEMLEFRMDLLSFSKSGKKYAHFYRRRNGKWSP